MHVRVKVTIFLGLYLKEEHILCLSFFSLMSCLGEMLGQTIDREVFGHYIYGF
jgi:hypothetical protein